MKTIFFPLINLTLNVNPVAFSLFGRPIFWYGIIVSLAIVLGLTLTVRLAKKQGLDSDKVFDATLWAIPFAIIFARLFYVVFSWDYYSQNMGEIWQIWNGGIAIYGAIIGAVLTILIYGKITKLPLIATFDLCAIGLILGQAIGRWGNFVNVEAYGTPTKLPWGMVIDEVAVHPTFLYESLWNFLGLGLLFIINKKKKDDGVTIASYLIWYGTGRFFIEMLRSDALMLGNLKISQMLSAIAVVTGISIIAYLKSKRKFAE